MSSTSTEGVSLPTATVVVVIVLTSVFTPLIGVTGASQRTASTADRLEAHRVSIDGSASLVRSGFGAGTYHISSIVVETKGLTGSGVIVLQLGVPWFDRYTTSMERQVRGAEGDDRTLRFQPTVEFPPGDVYPGRHPIRLTVRFRTAGESRIVSERTVELGPEP